MSATLLPDEKIRISEEVLRHTRENPIPSGSGVNVHTPEGKEIPLPKDVQEMVINALASIAANGEVTIGRTPEDLTSTVAAEILGVSRPTLMKWTREGKIDSFKVGTHTRFKREDILRLKEERSRDRRRAFNQLREDTIDNLDLFDD